MIFMRLNNKGYMLVEIIVSFVLACSIAMYLLNLTIKFKDTNESIYYSSVYLKDKNLITRNIMNDIKEGNIVDFSSGGNWIKFKVELDSDVSNSTRMMQVYKALRINDDNSIEYGVVTNYDEIYNREIISFGISDSSYYKKKLEDGLVVGELAVEAENDRYLVIRIPISSLYTEDNYDIILMSNYSVKG